MTSTHMRKTGYLYYRRAILLSLAMLLMPNAYAFSLKEPHWFGVGGGILGGRSFSPSLTFQGGRLWSEVIGTGCYLLAPSSSGDQTPEFFALGTIDLFDHSVGLQYSTLLGVGKNGDQIPFTAGAKLGYSQPFSRHWFWGLSGAMLWINQVAKPFAGWFQIEFQLRY